MMIGLFLLLSLLAPILRATATDEIMFRPNPLVDESSFQFSSQGNLRISVQAYDVTGRLVANILDEVPFAGPQSVTWNGTSRSGQLLPSGVYFIILRAGDLIARQKLTVVR